VAQRIMMEQLDRQRAAASGANKVLVDMKPLADMFRLARKHLKYPKLTVNIGATAYTFALASDNSRNPGHIYVKRDRVYIGKVSPAGELQLSRDAQAGDREAINEFSKNPAAVAGLHGKLTSQCAFCSKTLSDERSKEVGYGKICASHFNLPWG